MADPNTGMNLNELILGLRQNGMINMSTMYVGERKVWTCSLSYACPNTGVSGSHTTEARTVLDAYEDALEYLRTMNGVTVNAG